MRGRSTGGVFLAIGTAVFTATGAHAAGFALNNKSASALGAGLAGQAALADDASTVYNNPAGMVQLRGREVSVGLHRVATFASFSDDGSDTSGSGNDASVTAYIPAFYYVDEPAPDLRVGVAAYSPFGLGLKYDAQWTGRYHSIDSALHTYNVSPALAWRATPALAVGASIDMQYAEAALSKAVDFSAVGGTSDGYSRLTGNSWAVGYSLGLTWTVSETARLGAVFHSGMRQDLAGRATFSNVPAAAQSLFTNTDGKVAVNLPSIASISAAWDAGERLTLLADYTRTGWSTYRELRIRFDNSLPDGVTEQNWRDASRYNLGARYRLNPAWLLRAGFSYDATPIPDAQHRSPTTPDCDRRWYSVGARWDATPAFSLDMAFALMEATEIPIDNTATAGPGVQHTLKGTFDVSSSFVAFQGNWRF